MDQEHTYAFRDPYIDLPTKLNGFANCSDAIFGRCVMFLLLLMVLLLQQPLV